MLLPVHRVQLVPFHLLVTCPSHSAGNVNLYYHVSVHTAMHVKSKSEDKVEIGRKLSKILLTTTASWIMPLRVKTTLQLASPCVWNTLWLVNLPSNSPRTRMKKSWVITFWYSTTKVSKRREVSGLYWISPLSETGSQTLVPQHLYAAQSAGQKGK